MIMQGYCNLFKIMGHCPGYTDNLTQHQYKNDKGFYDKLNLCPACLQIMLDLGYKDADPLEQHNQKIKSYIIYALADRGKMSFKQIYRHLYNHLDINDYKLHEVLKTLKQAGYIDSEQILNDKYITITKYFLKK